MIRSVTSEAVMVVILMKNISGGKKKMLNGIDISHHNFYLQNLQDINEMDFVIMKATEGIRFKDNKLPVYMNVLHDDKLYGFYHFARPDLGNDPEDEALNFVNYIRKYITDRSILALDVEAGALKVTGLDKWCTTWMQIVEIETGILPMIYTSAAETKRFKGVCALGCGLWVAKWGKKPTQKQLEPWNFWAIWQCSSDVIFSGQRIDHDLFNGNREQYMKYCKVGK